MQSITGAYAYFNEEKPIIFFDTHPEPAPGIVYDSYIRLKNHLITAWTAVPNLDVSPGHVRLSWITTDGKAGKRDYSLREHAEARLGFDKLATLPEVRRVMILGYASQNPYTIYGESEFDKQERKRKELLETIHGGSFGAKRKGKENVGLQIDEILDEEERELSRKKEAKGGYEKVGSEEV